MKRKLRLWLSVLLAVACAGPVAALPEQGATAIWQSYVLQVEWAQIGDEAPDGMQAEAGMRYVRVHINSPTGGVRTADIGDYGWEIELRHDSDGAARAPEMYTSYSTTFDKGSSGLVSAEEQTAFDLLYRVPESWARDDITLVIPPYEGEDTLIPLRTLADAPPSEDTQAARAGAPADVPEGQGMYRLTLTPSASLDFPALDAETAGILTQTADFLEKVEIEASFTLLEGAPYAAIRLISDGTDLGVMEATLQGDLLYLRGDMMPEGWVTVDAAALMGGDGGLPTGAQGMDTLANIGVSIGQVLGAFADSMDEWYAAQPEALSTDIDMTGWPRYYYFNAREAERLHVPFEAVEQALGDTDTALRALARSGELFDLDGTPITSEAQYEGSLVQQLVAAAQNWYDYNGLALTMDSIRDAGTMLEASYDLAARDDMHYLLVLIRQLPWDGEGLRAYSGEVQNTLVGGQRLQAHLDILADTAAYQYDLHAAGSVLSNWTTVWFDSRLALTLPEEDSLFLASADTRIYDADNEIRVNLRADAADYPSDAGDGTLDALDLTLAVDLRFDLEDFEETQSLQAGLDIQYQRLDEEPVLHDLSDVRLRIDADTAQEDIDAYQSALETSLTGWLIKMMATLPSGLLQVIMADYM